MTNTMQLVIQSFGVKISLENGLLLIRNKGTLEKIPACQVDSIVISKGCTVSTNVIYYAAEHDIDIIFGSKEGKPVARIWSNKFGSIATIRKNQLLFAASDEAFKLVAEMLIGKRKHQQAVLSLLYHPDRDFDKIIDSAVLFIEKYVLKLTEQAQHDDNVNDSTIRGWEGVCSKSYFSVISHCLPTIYRFEKRTQHPAHDTFNAFLNYAYGILYVRIESAMVKRPESTQASVSFIGMSTISQYLSMM